jgi:hypothetical protein
MKNTRLANLHKMRDKYLDGGHDAAAARVEARIAEVEQSMPCDVCHCNPCQCDVQYDKGMDREMFPDD